MLPVRNCETFTAVLLLGASACAADPHVPGQFVHHPDIAIRLWAAEPLVIDPVAVAFTADGSCFVAEMRDLPFGIDPDRRPGGAVRRLRDTDGDGTAESLHPLERIAPPPWGPSSPPRGGERQTPPALPPPGANRTTPASETPPPPWREPPPPPGANRSTPLERIAPPPWSESLHPPARIASVPRCARAQRCAWAKKTRRKNARTKSVTAFGSGMGFAPGFVRR